MKKLVITVNRSHKGLGAMMAVNLLCAKAKKCILNVSPAGCGKATVWCIFSSTILFTPSRRSPIKSVATDTTATMLGTRAKKFTSLTLAGLKNITEELTEFGGHIVIDDLGGEKSEWSRTSTVTVLANLCHTHMVRKVTQSYVLEITNFYGSAALNIQPVLMDSIIGGSDWIAVVRDKVLRYYHMIRPLKPKQYLKPPEIWLVSCPNNSGTYTVNSGKLSWAKRGHTGHRFGCTTARSINEKEPR